MTLKKNEFGFTIVELLIVVVVIAILAAITIVSYNGIQSRAKDSAAINTSSQAAKKLATLAITNNDTFPQNKADFLSVTGLSESGQLSYEYSSEPPYTSYCLTTTLSSISYYTTNTNQTPTRGGCPGHNANGVSVITNMSVNPSFESSLIGVATYNVNLSRPTSGGDSGTAYMRATRNTTSGIWGPWWDAALTGVQEGKKYTVSIRTRSNVVTSRGLQIEWMNAGFTTIVGRVTLQDATPGANWTTMSGTATAVAGAAGIRLTLYANGTGTTSDYVDVDSVMITEGSSSVPYADGNTENWVWNGAPNESTSKGLPL